MLSGQERLTILVNFLESDNLRTVQFDIGTFATIKSKEPIAEGTCGTSACAIGLGAMIPELRAEGLRLIYEPAPGYRGKPDSLFESYYEATPAFDKYVAMPAICVFFDLTSDNACDLFYDFFDDEGDLRDRDMVAGDIRYFLRQSRNKGEPR